MMRILVPATVVAALGVATLPAATSGDDPCADANRKVGLFVLLSNTTSGTYDACLDDLRDRVARARLRARMLQREAARLQAEAENLEGERANAARRLAALNARQSDMLRRLDAAKESHDVDSARLKEVLAEEEAFAQKLAEANREKGTSAARVEDLQARTEALEREQEELHRRIAILLGED